MNFKSYIALLLCIMAATPILSTPRLFVSAFKQDPINITITLKNGSTISLQDVQPGAVTSLDIPENTEISQLTVQAPTARLKKQAVFDLTKAKNNTEGADMEWALNNTVYHVTILMPDTSKITTNAAKLFKRTDWTIPGKLAEQLPEKTIHAIKEWIRARGAEYRNLKSLYPA